MTADESLRWLQVLSLLVQTGKVTIEQVVDALKSVRGPTDVDTEAADDAALAVLRTELQRRIALAEADAQPPQS